MNSPSFHSFPGTGFKTRRGLAIPMVLGVLTVFAILILVLSQAGTDTYSQTAITNYNLHTRMIAMSAAELATTILHENLADPLSAKPWKIELVTAVIQGGEFNIDLMERTKFEKKLLQLIYSKEFVEKERGAGGFHGGERVTDLEKGELVKQTKYRILEALVRFHNFKPIKYDSLSGLGIYQDPRFFYHDPLNELPVFVPKNDLFGFYTIRIRVQFGRVIRDFLITRDMKIINNEPIARNYAVFAVGNPNPIHMQSDLNGPGKLMIYANEIGRIRIQGPYLLNVEGFPDGTGGGKSPVGIAYPTQKWEDYSFIPPPRGITVNGFLLSDGGIGRPKGKSGVGTSMGFGSDGGLSMVMPSSDPGLKALPEVQNYWAATVDVGEQNFSISGRRDLFNLWRGVAFDKGASPFTPSGSFNGFESLENGKEARIEGVLVGNYNQMHFAKKHACMSLGTIIGAFSSMGSMFGGGSTAGGSTAGNATAGSTDTSFGSDMAGQVADAIQICMHHYTVKKTGTVPAFYGLHAPYESKVDQFEAFMGIINDTVGSLATSGSGKEGGLVSALGESVTNMGKNLAKAEMTQNKLSGGLNIKGENWAAQTVNALPSNFKKFPRTAARYYPDMKTWYKYTKASSSGSKEMYFDGNVWIDELVVKNKIKYYGRGSLISAYSPGSELFTAKKDAEIMEMEPAREGVDHLNIFYRNAAAVESGKGMLSLKGDFTGSIYSYAGVKPDGDVIIEGNMVVELFNKAQFGEGNNLSVLYNRKYQDADKQQFDWFTVSLSPKISALSNHYKTLGQQGPGDDGVQVIVNTIGN